MHCGAMLGVWATTCHNSRPDQKIKTLSLQDRWGQETRGYLKISDQILFFLSQDFKIRTCKCPPEVKKKYEKCTISKCQFSQIHRNHLQSLQEHLDESTRLAAGAIVMCTLFEVEAIEIDQKSLDIENFCGCAGCRRECASHSFRSVLR